MQKVLITGANGFVGNYLVPKLARKGFEVIATGTGADRLAATGANYTYRNLDVANETAVMQLMEQARPDVVVHGAALTKPDECELDKEKATAINVNGTHNLLRAAAAFGDPFFLHISTDFIFKGTAPVYRENDAAEPVNFYGQTKWEAEQAVHQYKGDWTIVRPILIYGNPQAGRSNILTFVADALKEGKPVRLFTDQQRRPTYVEDLVWALYQIIRKRKTGIYHLSGKDTLSPYDIAIHVARYLQLDEGLVHAVTESEFYQPAKRPPQTLFDLTKAEQELGFLPTSFDEGLRRTFEQRNRR